MNAVTSIIALAAYNVPSSQATAYTVPNDAARFRIDHASVSNYTGSPVTITVYVLQSGDSVANIQKAIDALTIPANTTVPLFELVGRALDTGGIINAFAGSASALALHVTGTKFTS